MWHVADYLTWLAGELGKFNEYEKGRAAWEVNNVALGRYDWLIPKKILTEVAEDEVDSSISDVVISEF